MNIALSDFLTIIGLLGALVAVGFGAYLAVRLDLVRQHERHIGLAARVDDHIANDDVHLHRRSNDPTGRYYAHDEGKPA